MRAHTRTALEQVPTYLPTVSPSLLPTLQPTAVRPYNGKQNGSRERFSREAILCAGPFEPSVARADAVADGSPRRLKWTVCFS
jgi:hypothetical protein